MKHRNQRQTIIKPFIVLFLFFCGTHFGLAEELDMLEKIRKNGEAVVHYTVGDKKHSILLKGMKEYDPKRQYSDEEVAAMREVLKRKVKYKIGERFYTLTDDEWKLVSSRKVISNYIRLVLYPDAFIVRPDFQGIKEEKEKGFIIYNSTKFNTYKKGETVPLIPQSTIQKTNNLSLYLADHTTDEGDLKIIGQYSGISTYRLRANKEYSKKVDVIENYYSIIEQLTPLKMTEIKEKISLYYFGASFCLVLKKDFIEEVSELYFFKRNNHDFIVIEPRKGKFYHLKDEKGILLKTFVGLLEKTNTDTSNETP